MGVSAAPKKPVYIGARACGACHAGQGMGNQYSLWLHSKHSQAWAALSRPESRQIAAISGLRERPQEAAICLGCHATAYNAEPWEKDDTFRTEDGVQCERCHGPGSEYATAAVMSDRKAAMAAGLRMPTEDDCINCHIEKGSHLAVLKITQPDIRKRLQEVAHPLPKAGRGMGSIPERERPGYTGSFACGKCHRGPKSGHQYSKWRRGPHARAWAVLGTARGYEVAGKRGVKSDPTAAPECLKCHSDGASVDEGVGCEACHGAGSSHPAVKKASRDTCTRCHQDKKFDYEAALRRIAHPSKPPADANGPLEVRYKTPLNLALRPGTRELYVTCEASNSVLVIDTATNRIAVEIAVGEQPQEVAFTPDGKLAFVSNRHDDTVSVIDAAARKAIRTLAAGDEPHGLLTDRQGRWLYVLNTRSNDISVFDASSLQWVKNLSAGRGPWSAALSPDGTRLFATNLLARFSPLRTPFVSEVTSIEAGRAIVDDRLVVPDANLMMGIDWHPSGEFALATLNRTKNLVPMTRLLQGWTITNGLAVLWADGTVDEVLLDEPNLGFADVTDVACTPDGRHALVTSATTDRVAVIDIAALTGLIRKTGARERREVLPNHLGKSVEFVAGHIGTQRSPRGVLVMPDAKTAYVANALDDSLTVIDIAKRQAVARVDLGGPREITRARYGERLFHDAKVTFRRQYSCHSCHPDGHVDGVTYDIEGDGLGISPVDNRTLRGILDTAPFKWEGTNPSLQRQCGARLAVFFTRNSPFTPDELSAIDHYITTILRPPNRFRALGAPLTPAQRRGKAIFDRTTTNDGREIEATNRCVACHFPPYFTDRRRHDVGTKQPLDRAGNFDTPHLNNIYDSAPYLHNGMAATLEEIWTVYNPNDRHGVTNDMTKDQLNDLIEFLKTL
jgi:YVTN family beta-propeller protein